ncbi:hypothetical protein AcW1_002842 [Taiwanofungus camphoratus]|nr:hypothetical protein AcW1_002842 [Antrodia cinnamomea]
MSSIISLNVEFGGGLELLFSNRRKHRIDLPARVPAAAASTASERGPEASAEGEQPQGRPADITYLILWLRDNLLTERAELFVENGTVLAPAPRVSPIALYNAVYFIPPQALY